MISTSSAIFRGTTTIKEARPYERTIAVLFSMSNLDPIMLRYYSTTPPSSSNSQFDSDNGCLLSGETTGVSADDHARLSLFIPSDCHACLLLYRMSVCFGFRNLPTQVETGLHRKSFDQHVQRRRNLGAASELLKTIAFWSSRVRYAKALMYFTKSHVENVCSLLHCTLGIMFYY